MEEGWGAFAFWLAIGAGQVAFWVAVTPLFKAWAHRIHNGGQSERVAQLEERLATLEQTGLTSGEVEQQFSRISEVEERLEFAERMLTQQFPTQGKT